jgi:hypothetical protein
VITTRIVPPLLPVLVGRAEVEEGLTAQEGPLAKPLGG